jgi:type II secretory pathway pseudopilin PulG
MQKNKKNKRSITLIEMIVVMILIATISGAIAYNYKKSLNEGKAFKTEAAMSRIQNAIELEILKDPSKAHNIESTWQKLIKDSPLISDTSYFKDGWGVEFQVMSKGDGVEIISEKLNAYRGTQSNNTQK